MRTTHLRQADLNLLVVFTVLAEERNVTRAAARLLLSQPPIEPRVATDAAAVPRRSAHQEFIRLCTHSQGITPLARTRNVLAALGSSAQR